MSATHDSSQGDAASAPVNGTVATSSEVPASNLTLQPNGLPSDPRTPAKQSDGTSSTISETPQYVPTNPRFMDTPQNGASSLNTTPSTAASGISHAASTNTMYTPSPNGAPLTPAVYTGSPTPARNFVNAGTHVDSRPIKNGGFGVFTGKSIFGGLGRFVSVNAAAAKNGSVQETKNETKALPNTDPFTNANVTRESLSQNKAETKDKPAPLPKTWDLPNTYDAQHFGNPLPGPKPAWELAMPSDVPDVGRAYYAGLYANEEDRKAGRASGEELRFASQDQAPYTAMGVGWAKDKQSQARFVMSHHHQENAKDEGGELWEFIRARRAEKQREAQAEAERVEEERRQAEREHRQANQQQAAEPEAARVREKRTSAPQVQEVVEEDDEEYISNILIDARERDAARATNEHLRTASDGQGQQAQEATPQPAPVPAPVQEPEQTQGLVKDADIGPVDQDGEQPEIFRRETDSIVPIVDDIKGGCQEFVRDHTPTNPLSVLVLPAHIFYLIILSAYNFYYWLKSMFDKWGRYMLIGVAFATVAYFMISVGYLIKDVHMDPPYAVTHNAGHIFEHLNTPFVPSGSLVDESFSVVGSIFESSVNILYWFGSLLAGCFYWFAPLSGNCFSGFTSFIGSLYDMLISTIIGSLSLLDRLVRYCDTLAIPQLIRDQHQQYLLVLGLVLYCYTCWVWFNEIRHCLNILLGNLPDTSINIPPLFNITSLSNQAKQLAGRLWAWLKMTSLRLRRVIFTGATWPMIKTILFIIWSLVMFLAGFGFRDFYDGFEQVTIVAQPC